VDDDPVEVADDQQRRVFERLAVLQELVVGGGEVLVFALVFPAEAAALPHVGPAFAAAVLRGAALEGEGLTRRISRRRFRVAEHFAEIEEMLLRGRALGERDFAPLGDEFGGRHVARPLLSQATHTAPAAAAPVRQHLSARRDDQRFDLLRRLMTNHDCSLPKNGPNIFRGRLSFENEGTNHT
jgi:hypothetical protein